MRLAEGKLIGLKTVAVLIQRALFGANHLGQAAFNLRAPEASNEALAATVGVFLCAHTQF